MWFLFLKALVENTCHIANIPLNNKILTVSKDQFRRLKFRKCLFVFFTIYRRLSHSWKWILGNSLSGRFFWQIWMTFSGVCWQLSKYSVGSTLYSINFFKWSHLRLFSSINFYLKKQSPWLISPWYSFKFEDFIYLKAFQLGLFINSSSICRFLKS